MTGRLVTLGYQLSFEIYTGFQWLEPGEWLSSLYEDCVVTPRIVYCVNVTQQTLPGKERADLHGRKSDTNADVRFS